MVMPPAQDSRSQLFIQKAAREREMRASGKSRATAILFSLGLTVAGILMIVFLYPGGGNSAPQCDGHTMSPGDKCVIIGSDGGTFSYHQMLQRQEASHPTWLVIGIIALLLAIVFFMGVFTTYNPKRPWGTPVQGYCPRCGQPSLREKLTSYSVTRGRQRTTWRTMVALCTPQCGYGATRQP
ncbi:MAG: hypothetical protein J2P25_05565 [Nocardiopsaceae bacterium]|nr:hypothetical protein [Nocardiopsaceae bacterium]